MRNWQKESVLVIGAARQGLALTRYLCAQGSRVTLNDNRSPDQLIKVFETLAGLPVNLKFGGHPKEILDGITLVCVSGGVSPQLPLIQEAREKNIPISNDAQIFMESVPCQTIGITGSAGKTTTTTLVGRIARAGAKPGQTIWVGGNIGTPLISHLGEMKAEDLVVLELSSFQLELMTTSPKTSAILNITPNHLDRHGTMEAYTAAKRRILEFQNASDNSVLSRDDANFEILRHHVKGNLTTFGLNRPAGSQNGTFLSNSHLMYFDGNTESKIIKKEDIALRGDHNMLNALAACAISLSAGFDSQAIQDGIKGFAGVEHRLEFVDVINGAAWYNDSIATAPERAMAAIQSFSEPIVLLLGGRDKKLPWDGLARLIQQRVDHVIVFGESAPLILDALQAVQTKSDNFTIDKTDGLNEAVQIAFDRSQPGDVVLLAPGGTSFDEFTDFEERGKCYKTLVKNLH